MLQEENEEKSEVIGDSVEKSWKDGEGKRLWHSTTSFTLIILFI